MKKMNLLAMGIATITLAACGGGGGSTSASNAPTVAQFSNANQYVGTWVSACDNHSYSSNSVLTIGNSNGILQLNSTGQYFSKLNCAGQPAVTTVDSRTITVSYVSSIAASIPLSPGGPIVNLTVEKVANSSPAGVNTITVAPGSGVTLTNGLAYDGVTSNNPGKCFSLSADNSTCVPNNLPSLSGSGSGPGGIYVQGSDMYVFDITSTGVVSVIEKYRRL